MKIIFATQNPNKVKEIQAQLSADLQIQSLLDLGFHEDLVETKSTLEGNALQKARFVSQKFNANCFADDTGLEVDQLDGDPGVYSARYAGPEKSFQKNMDKLLLEMQGMKNRKAKFRTVIACILEGEEHLFEGICEGEIALQKKGKGGFGYDPIFLPKDYHQTFAEMSLDLKNRIGHRGKAVSQLIDFLNRGAF